MSKEKPETQNPNRANQTTGALYATIHDLELRFRPG
jgi:hypothetical protein